MPASEDWTDAEHVRRYLERADDFPRRSEGESVLLNLLPEEPSRVLDLGAGDGRLLAHALTVRPGAEGVALDFSEVMLGRARARFAADARVQIVEHALAGPPSRICRLGSSRLASRMASTSPWKSPLPVGSESASEPNSTSARATWGSHWRLPSFH